MLAEEKKELEKNAKIGKNIVGYFINIFNSNLSLDLCELPQKKLAS